MSLLKKQILWTIFLFFMSAFILPGLIILSLACVGFPNLSDGSTFAIWFICMNFNMFNLHIWIR